MTHDQNEVNRRRVLKAFVLTTAVAGGFAETSRADSKEYDHIVGEGEKYENIQDAVDAAEPGDSIKVKEGIYEEHVKIRKSVCIIGDPGSDDEIGPGENAPIIDGGDVDSDQPIPRVFDVFQVEGSVVIEGFEIVGFTKDWEGIAVRETSDVAVRDSYIEDIRTGITTQSPFNLEDGWEVRRNELINPDIGIELQNVSNSDIVANRIVGMGEPKNDGPVYGISFRLDELNDETDGGVAKDLRIMNNVVLGHFGDGNPSIDVAAVNSKAEDVIVKSNEIRKNGGNHPSVGISPKAHSGGSIENLSIESNSVSDAKDEDDIVGTGIKIGSNLDGEIRNNDILDNRVGVWDGGSEVKITRNNISGNSDWGANNGDASNPTEATCNYWGHATGPQHEDNPRPNPKGDPVNDNVEFNPWSVREIRDGKGSCHGGRGGSGADGNN